jgi:MoaA/NifB/PqqE/SkfB family radical SAM enzyme
MRVLDVFDDATVKNPIMYWEEVKNVVQQAIELGLESIKFLGPGELTTNPRLFEILDYFQDKNIVVGMFTKAALLDSDFLAQKYHSMSSSEFVEKLVAYDNVTFLVGGRSFDPILENKFIPTKNRDEKELFDYHVSRNLALKRLCDAGLNKDPHKRGMAIITSPVGPETIDGVFEIFKWGIEKNIPVIVTTTMVSGKGHRMVKRHQQTPFEIKYEKLAVDIYEYLISSGLMSSKQLKQEGVSLYVGVTPCNQLTHGLYIHYDGEVWRCPRNDTSAFVVHPNVRDQSLLEIWKQSKNYRLQTFNNGCVKDGITVASGFYKRVAQQVL